MRCRGYSPRAFPKIDMNNYKNTSRENFKRVSISEDEGLMEIRDKLSKASKDHVARKIIGRISKEIGPVELEERNFGGSFA